jgi:hypothetical protein
MQTDNTKMQTDIKENNNEHNNGCIIANTLEKEDFKFAIDLEDSIDSNSDSDGDELDALNESFKLACGSQDEDKEDKEDKEELAELAKYTNYTCIMCSNILKVRTSFCNASCEQKYFKNEK